jgi:hypothetical protein
VAETLAVALADMSKFAPSRTARFLPALSSALSIYHRQTQMKRACHQSYCRYADGDELKVRRHLYNMQKAHVDMAPLRSTRAERVFFFAYKQVLHTASKKPEDESHT